MISSVVKNNVKNNILLIAASITGFVGAPFSNAQNQANRTGDWTAHTSFRQVRSIDASSTHIWSATSGGVYSYEIDSGEIERFTVVSGLHGVEATTLAVDTARNFIWIGYRDGVFDRLDVESRTVISFLDISRATQFASRGINRMRVHGDSLLISTDFGVVVFDPLRSEVRDTYSRLGDNPAATTIRDILVAPDESGEPQFWVATVDGVARAAVNAANLQDPASWTNERTGFDGNSSEIHSLAVFGGSLYVGTASDLFRRRQTPEYDALFATTNTISQIFSTSEMLVAVERFRLVVIDPSQSVFSVNLEGLQDPSSVVIEPDVGVWIGDLAGGLQAVGDPGFSSGIIDVLFSVIPNGPFDGLFSDLHTTSDGTLWAGGQSVAKSGFSRLGADGEWTTYSELFFNELRGASRFTTVYADRADEGWSASEGAGVAHVSPDGSVTLFDASNSSLKPAAGTQSFIIAAGVTADAAGNIWVTTMASDTPLHVRTPDGIWTGFEPVVGDGLSSRATAYNKIYNDSFDQKWIIVRSENNLSLTKGLMVLDTGDPLDANDDVHRFFDEDGGSGQGLPSFKVSSVVEDRDGLVWIGTESGPAYFVNTGIIARDANATAIWPQWADRSQGTFMLFGLRINDVAIDPANRIWFATAEGAWLVQAVEGGYEAVHHFTTDNSPLFSDEVTAIDIDQSSGRVYIGTDLGLLSFDSGAVAPSREASDLFIYPNPVRFSESANPVVTIDGLVERTEIRILTASGSLVRRLTGRGGRITWDAKDERGRLVDSGIYIVAAVGQDGEGTAYGRVAVIR